MVSIVVKLLTDRQHHALVRNKPQRQLARGVLKQHGHEALQRAERGTVNHHGTVLLVVGTGILELETLGQVVVHLDGAQLPAAAQSILDHKVQLGTIEGRLAGHLLGNQALLLTSLDDGALGLFPYLIASHIFLLVIGVTQRNLSLIVETEYTEDKRDDVHHAQELLLQLVGRAEQVSIVLRETAHARQSVQLTTLLIAVNGTELGIADRKVTVTAGSGLVDLAVVGAVHGFEHVLLTLLGRGDGTERVLTILGIVTAGDIQQLVADVWRDHLLIAITLLDLGKHVLQAVAQGSTLGKPQGQTLAHVGREGKQFHLLADLAVVALLGLLKQHEVLVEHLLLGEGDAIHAGQLRAGLVTAPVGASERHHLDGLDHASRGDMRATAQVGEVTLGISGDVTVFQVIDEFALQGLALVAEELQRIGLADVGADNSLIFLCEFSHLFLNLGEVCIGQGGAASVDVIVETILHSGTNTELYVGIQLLKGLGQQVCRCVPEGVFALGVLPLKARCVQSLR